MNGDPLDELDEQGAEITRLRADVERLRLTDEEREVLGHEVELAEYQQRHDVVATLRGLLERTADTHATPEQGSVQGQ